ncbi:hypothetical protein [Agrobacterium tumefaciens]|uniref:hypothetical protein n=1 Tax=Agrobacterium tumefaciens TaxID=358 RepID=UPI00155F9F33|nr:hypothetical protein [Agrobacterium tumefaciens]
MPNSDIRLINEITKTTFVFILVFFRKDINGLKASALSLPIRQTGERYDKTSRVAVPLLIGRQAEAFRNRAQGDSELFYLFYRLRMNPWNLRILDFTKSLNEVLPSRASADNSAAKSSFRGLAGSTKKSVYENENAAKISFRCVRS